MKKNIAYLLLAAIGLLTACDSNSDGTDDSPVVINIPEGDDDECCSLDDELAMRRLFANYKELSELTGIGFGKYTIRVYSKYDTLRVGHAELLFAVEKTETGQHVKDIRLSDLVPVMTMGAMGMKHSAPTSSQFQQIDKLPVFSTWFAPQMASDANSYWELSFNYVIRGSEGKAENLRFGVKAQSAGQTWIKSFKLNDRTYYLSLVGAEGLKTGENTLQAYVTRTGEDKTLPYYEATETFTIEIVPTMPDMGNHSSPGNTPLLKQETGIYEGKLNLSMTGLWNIHLVVKDETGTIVAGADNDSSGYSNLFWTVTI